MARPGLALFTLRRSLPSHIPTEDCGREEEFQIKITFRRDLKQNYVIFPVTYNVSGKMNISAIM